MLQNKDIANIQEVKTLFKETWTQPQFLAKYVQLFNFKKSSTLFNSVKKSGIPYWEVFKVLLVLPFAGTKNIKELKTNTISLETVGEKDVYYRSLANQKVDWRKLLQLFVDRYLTLDSKFTSPKDDFKCLIFDDTDLPKRGKKIEGISKTFNHVSKQFIFGFKLLVAGYWNGSVFIPVDFSLHRENKDNKTKKYGLSNKERKNQNKTQRDKNLPVFKRFQELNFKKTDMVISMFKRISKRKITVNYILFDSWFTTVSLIKKLQKINNSVDIIGIYKYNSKLIIEGKELSIKQLRKYQSKVSRSRSMKMYYFEYTGILDEVEVKIFITKRGVNGSWHTILTTDTSLTFVKAMKIYNTRWTIEVFFKEVKQLLGLGKSQSTNFDVQIAQTTLTMLQYLIVSLKYRIDSYETIGGMFKNIKQDFIKHKLNERILAVIFDILTVLEFIIPNIDFNEVVEKLMLHSEAFAFLGKNQESINLRKLAA